MIRRLAILAALVAATAGGCATDPTQGYAPGALFSPDVTTVAVPIFDNDAFERGIEFDLTNALVTEIESRTPYKVVSTDRADTVLRGRIRTVTLDQLSKSRRTGLGEEVVVEVTVDFEWRDARDNRLLVGREGYSGSGLFTPSGPIGEPIDIGRLAAVRELARDIVDEMRVNW